MGKECVIILYSPAESISLFSRWPFKRIAFAMQHNVITFDVIKPKAFARETKAPVVTDVTNAPHVTYSSISICLG
jgi:hypothetical protein